MVLPSCKFKASKVLWSFALDSYDVEGLISPPSEPPGEIMSFGVSPVNYTDSDSDVQLAQMSARNYCYVPS